MNRGWARTLALTSLVPLLASVGCDALTARPFAGTIMQLTFAGMGETPAGQHLELWATTANDDIVRIDAFTDETNYLTANGFVIRQAIALDSPCMIADNGNLLTSAAAYPSSVTIAGVTQTPEQQAQQIVDRIKQLTPATGVLLAVLPYDPTPMPTIPADATPDVRKKMCTDWENSGDPAAQKLHYVPNPLQITSPLHGVVYGFVSFTSLTPPANYDGWRIDTPINLAGLREIFFTTEMDNVDPKNRGPLFLVSTPTPGGRDVVHFDLTHADPLSTATGTAALYVNLNEDPVQF